MKRLISDEELIDYVNGRLTKSENKRIKKLAIENGETDLLLNVTIANYKSQKEYADWLLGEDDFNIEKERGHQKVVPQISGFMMAADKDIEKKDE